MTRRLSTVVEEPAEGWIPLSDPDLTARELAAVDRALRGTQLTMGAGVVRFEEAFAAYVGRRHAVAVASAQARMARSRRITGTS